MKVFTMVTAPFKLGGTHEPMATDLEPKHVLPIYGRRVGFLKHPNLKQWYTVDMESGAFVGGAPTMSSILSRVQSDLEKANPEVVERQVKHAIALRDTAKLVEPDYFWSRFKK